MSEQPMTKAAKDIEAGDWCALGVLSWRAGQPVVLDDGKILIPWGNGTDSVFGPDERITMHQE